MNFEFNKIAGAVLGTALGVMVVGIVADTIYAPHAPEQPGYIIAVADPVEGGEAPAAPEVEPIADRLQVASVDKGKTAVAKCATCHNFEKGAPNKVGPNLWDVVGHNVIHGDFNYSAAMREKGEEGMEWTYENLDGFLANPRRYIPGTAMSFAGIRNPVERADIIAYMRTLADNPLPLPLPPPTPAPTAEAPTETPPQAGESPPASTGSPPAETPDAPETVAPPPDERAVHTPEAEPMTAPETEQPATTPAPEAPAATSEEPAPAPAPAPAEDQPAASGTSDGAQPAPAPEAAPDAEADSPEGAPAPEAPAP